MKRKNFCSQEQIKKQKIKGMTTFACSNLVCADVNSAAGPLLVGNVSSVTIGKNGSPVDVLGNLLVAGSLTVNNQSSQEFTMPATRGTANQYLTSDGQGATQWSNLPPPLGAPDTIQDSLGTTNFTCATPGEIKGFLPGMAGPTILAEAARVALTTPSFEAASGSSLNLGDDGGWEISNKSTAITASSDSQPAKLEVSTVNAGIEMTDSQVETSIAAVVRDRLDATERVFSGTDGVARLTITDPNVTVQQQLHVLNRIFAVGGLVVGSATPYAFPLTPVANKSLICNTAGNGLQFKYPPLLQSDDALSTVSCTGSGSTFIENGATGFRVFDATSSSTRLNSPDGNAWFILENSAASTLRTLQDFDVTCANFSVNGYKFPTSGGNLNEILTSNGTDAVWRNDAVLTSVTTPLVDHSPVLNLGPSAANITIGGASTIVSVESQLNTDQIEPRTSTLLIATVSGDVNIGKSGTTTQILGSVSVADQIITSTIDSLSNITIGHAPFTTNVNGTFSVNSHKFPTSGGTLDQILTSDGTDVIWSSDAILGSVTTPVVDHSPVLSLGPSANTMFIGGTAANISVGGASTIVSVASQLNTDQIEPRTSMLSIAALSGNITIGKSGKTTHILGNLSVAGQLIASTIDSLSSITIGSALITTTVNGTLSVGGAYTMPSIPGNAGEALITNGLGAAAWTSLGNYALTSQPLSQFAATSSAQLRGVMSDETGTGLLVFNDSPTFLTPTLNAATATSIDAPASNTLNIGTNVATAGVSIGRSGLTTTITGASLIVPASVDVTSGPLAIGGNNATVLSIGRAAGTSVDILSRLNVNLIDRSSAGTLTIGSASATAVSLGNAATGSIVNIVARTVGVGNAATGSLVNILAPRLNVPLIDRSSNGTLSIGASNSQTVAIGKSGSGNVVNIIAPRLNASAIDVTAGVLSIGTTTATGINIGGSSASSAGITVGGTGVRTRIQGLQTQVDTLLLTPKLDSLVAAAALDIGTTNAGLLTLGRTGQTTNIAGTAKISGAFFLPTAAAATADQVLVADGSTGTLWKRPGGFTQTFGGTISNTANYLAVNGMYTSAEVVTVGLGGQYIIPVQCTLRTISYTVGTTPVTVNITAGGSLTTLNTTIAGYGDLSPAVSLGQGAVVFVQLSALTSALVTLYFE